ncbi:MAG: three-Cys-motif partner protein TcmP [Planctomycetota bacterium]|jgi:three-Cys-motif partner protein
MSALQFDEIGYWSEVKLAIVKEYAQAYATIMNAQRAPRLEHHYIDAFASSGISISRTTGDYVPGSPLNALLVSPRFHSFHFIDLDGDKTDQLRNLTRAEANVAVYTGDCNSILPSEVLPLVRYENYRRALCLLDPYGLHLNWDVIQAVGKMRSIDIFLNFPIMDMNRNVLWRNPEGVEPEQTSRMDAFWGDESWRAAAYRSSGQMSLFDGEAISEKAPNTAVAEAFRKRLRGVAGFGYVPDPMPMRNSTGAVVYYLFFASQKPVAKKIVEDIFAKYRDMGTI